MWGGEAVASNIDIERMKENISRLTAALEDVNFECQRLEIINSNLDLQLKEVNRELNRNIAVLQALEDENESLKKQLAQLKEKNNG
ncbi:MAG: hypothetical protein LUH82_00200 [Clostridiales bacterium]|nr:hypothetical protein [Clostridiales bacterium]